MRKRNKMPNTGPYAWANHKAHRPEGWFSVDPILEDIQHKHETLTMLI
jgi:hypothetical protein